MASRAPACVCHDVRRLDVQLVATSNRTNLDSAIPFRIYNRHGHDTLPLHGDPKVCHERQEVVVRQKARKNSSGTICVWIVFTGEWQSLAVREYPSNVDTLS